MGEGLSCCKKTPASIYQKHLFYSSTTELTKHWPPIKLFKLKKLYEANCEITSPMLLFYDKFISLFPEFNEKMHNYSEVFITYQDKKKKVF